MEAQFEIHRTDNRPFYDGEGYQIFMDAIARTRHQMFLKSITQANGSVSGMIQLIGDNQYYRIQLLLTELKKISEIRLTYRGG